jgi:hypothetical protein
MGREEHLPQKLCLKDNTRYSAYIIDYFKQQIQTTAKARNSYLTGTVIHCFHLNTKSVL